METIPREETTKRGLTLAEQMRDLKKKVKHIENVKETKRKSKQFRWPMKWKMKFNKANRPNMREMMLVIFLNKKNEIEPPKFMPIFEDMIIYKNRPYEFDPRAVWTIRGMRKNPKAYIIKEIDRRPVRNKVGRIIYTDSAVSNQDLGDVRARGDSTESDAFLVKTVLSAFMSKQKKMVNKGVLIAVGLIVVGIIIYFLSKGGG